jgi:hypothetical protein
MCLLCEPRFKRLVHKVEQLNICPMVRTIPFLPNLQELNVKDSSISEINWINFLHLKKLHVENCPELTGFGEFRELEVFKIKNCEKFEIAPTSAKMKLFSVTDCKRFVKIPQYQEIEWLICKNCGVTSISEMITLKLAIFEDLEIAELPPLNRLRTLEVFRCHSLRSIKNITDVHVMRIVDCELFCEFPLVEKFVEQCLQIKEEEDISLIIPYRYYPLTIETDRKAFLKNYIKSQVEKKRNLYSEQHFELDEKRFSKVERIVWDLEKEEREELFNRWNTFIEQPDFSQIEELELHLQEKMEGLFYQEFVQSFLDSLENETFSLFH